MKIKRGCAVLISLVVLAGCFKSDVYGKIFMWDWLISSSMPIVSWGELPFVQIVGAASPNKSLFCRFCHPTLRAKVGFLETAGFLTVGFGIVGLCAWLVWGHRRLGYLLLGISALG